jgi:hypothetical protein
MLNKLIPQQFDPIKFRFPSFLWLKKQKSADFQRFNMAIFCLLHRVTTFETFYQ